MPALKWVESVDQPESLALCLAALSAAHGRRTGYGEWIAALGLGAATVAMPAICARRWPSLARDLSLASAAAVYGFVLRELHPPDAAVGLALSGEFPQHFDDSYRPLVSRALQNGQRALAWRGWGVADESPADEWGLIDREAKGELLGWASGGANPRPLSAAPHQVYVVEDVMDDWTPPGAEAQLNHARAAASAYWRADQAVRFGVQFGKAAWNALSGACRGRCACGASGVECASYALRRMGLARAELARWLEGLRQGPSSEVRAAATRWSASLYRILDRLGRVSASECEHACELASAEEVALHAELLRN
ncbi:MAG: hypothetical protein U1D55_11945 [Phycisphaerae bacterium]